MPVHALVYVSQAAEGLSPDHLESLVKDAARFNALAGVTGLLISDGVMFLQYLEGPEDGLQVAYDRVLASSSHIDIVQLARGLIGSRLAPYWSMTLVGAPREELGSIAKADWNSFVRRGSVTRPTAVDHLMAVVERQREQMAFPG